MIRSASQLLCIKPLAPPKTQRADRCSMQSLSTGFWLAQLSLSRMEKDLPWFHVDMYEKSHRSRALEELMLPGHKQEGTPSNWAQRGGNRQGHMMKPAERVWAP